MARRIHLAGTDLTRRGESGASLVEFALILPLFVSLVLGMFTGGLAYNRKLTITNAAREATRFGATLPMEGLTVSEWIDKIGAVAIDAATSEMAADAPDREICIAYVNEGAGTSTRKIVVGTGTFSGTAAEPGLCFDDTANRPDDEERVQVALERGDRIEILFADFDVTLRGRATNKYEAAS